MKSIWVAADDDQSHKIWFQLAELGKKGAFSNNKTFKELAELMVQIKVKEEEGKSKTSLRYSEHLKQFFCLLSNSSREYEIFKQSFVGMNLRSLR